MNEGVSLVKGLFSTVMVVLISILLVGCQTASNSNMNSDPGIEKGFVLKVDKNKILLAKDISAEKFKEIKNKPLSKLLKDPQDVGLVYVYYSDIDNIKKGDQVKVWIKDGLEDSYPQRGDAKKIEKTGYKQ